jgi:hypothetical protein
METNDEVGDSEQVREAAPVDSASIAVKLAEADSLAAQAADYRKAAVEILSEAHKLLADAKAAAVAISALAEKTANDQAVIATKSAHIQDAQIHADKVRAELDKVLTAASGDAAKAEALRTRSQSASDDIAKVSGDVAASKNSVDAALAAVVEAQGSSEASSATTSGLAEKANQIESNLGKYERRLQELDEQSQKQLDTITGLLPGATSTGLASAFNTRADSFKTPQKRWQWVFISSLLFLIALGLTGAWHAIFSNAILSYDELVRLWLARLPVAAALLWLTLHAGRESALSKRLEEDYGYKSAIASSFEGFRHQMAETSSKAGDGTPLSKLCDDTLSTIATPPGRIYERHKLTVTPGNEIAALATAVVAAIKARGENKTLG